MVADQYPFPLSLAVWGHVVGGALALATFLIPILSRKGGTLHVWAGWLYAAAMTVVAGSSFMMTPWRFFFDPSRTADTKGFAFFLFFIATMSITTLQQGLYVFKRKLRTEKQVTIGAIGLPAAFALVSILTAAAGVMTETILFIVFGALGIAIAAKQIRYWINPPKEEKHWWFYHLENMFICSTATVTAFAVTAVPKLFPTLPPNPVWLWLLPATILIPWMNTQATKYRRQFKPK